MEGSRVFAGVLVGLMAGSALASTAVAGLEPAGADGVARAAPDVVQDTVRKDTTVFVVDPLVVTATRTPRPVFVTPAAVSVIDSLRLQREKPNTITDLFRDVAGLDVSGVGVQQPRPVIRGQRGQRILLLGDGLRLNNSRRQQDFGEVPALVDPSQVERVEVVRGPSSVLYGTDAIGGVVNVITRRPTADGIHGMVGHLFGLEEDQHRTTGALFARAGALDFNVTGAFRQAGDYRAPEGTFGDIRLDSATTVQGTGVRDWNVSARAAWSIAERHSVFGRVERYESEDAAFGFVEPGAYAASQPRIDIRYPDQRFTRVTAGYAATELGLPFLDRLDATTYWQDNERTLTFDLFQGFGPRAPPGAGVKVNTHNFTDLGTLGLRLEAKKLAAPRVLLTYGLDFFRDRSRNTDSSVSVVVGFGPPRPNVSTRPLVPAATYRSLGVFAQGELTLGPATVIVGGRVQDVRAEVEPGQGVPAGLTSKGRSTVVGSANLLYALTPKLSLVGSVGRGFRTPNLIEWFFEGPTPEGNGYQVRSPDLEPETSLNLDVGARYRDARFAVEAFVFRNQVRNGIRIQPRGDTIQGFPAYRNVNLDKLLFRGVEVTAEAVVGAGFSVIGGWSTIDSEDQLDPSNPIGDSFSTKVTGAFRHRDPAGRFWAEYGVRHNGERKDVELSRNPLGEVLPSFTTHHLRAGLALPRSWAGASPRLGIAVENLTNELYAEFANASFFRPEPRRRVTLSLDVSF